MNPGRTQMLTEYVPSSGCLILRRRVHLPGRAWGHCHSGVHAVSNGSARCTTNTEHHFSAFSVKVKIPFGFLLVQKNRDPWRSFVKVTSHNANFRKAEETLIIKAMYTRRTVECHFLYLKCAVRCSASRR